MVTKDKISKDTNCHGGGGLYILLTAATNIKGELEWHKIVKTKNNKTGHSQGLHWEVPKVIFEN